MNRDDQRTIMVPMTIAQAEDAVRALNHAGREIHDRDERGLALIALSETIDAMLPTRTRR
jgi:hypothetical protein